MVKVVGPIFKETLQIAIIVRNFDEAVRRYYDEYGIGPWAIYEFNPQVVKDMIIRDGGLITQ